MLLRLQLRSKSTTLSRRVIPRNSSTSRTLCRNSYKRLEQGENFVVNGVTNEVTNEVTVVLTYWHVFPVISRGMCGMSQIPQRSSLLSSPRPSPSASTHHTHSVLNSLTATKPQKCQVLTAPYRSKHKDWPVCKTGTCVVEIFALSRLINFETRHGKHNGRVLCYSPLEQCFGLKQKHQCQSVCTSVFWVTMT